jgi:hypothetical protein
LTAKGGEANSALAVAASIELAREHW